jgi:hypothetical protein
MAGKSSPGRSDRAGPRVFHLEPGRLFTNLLMLRRGGPRAARQGALFRPDRRRPGAATRLGGAPCARKVPFGHRCPYRRSALPRQTLAMPGIATVRKPPRAGVRTTTPADASPTPRATPRPSRTAAGRALRYRSANRRGRAVRRGALRAPEKARSVIGLPQVCRSGTPKPPTPTPITIITTIDCDYSSLARSLLCPLRKRKTSVRTEPEPRRTSHEANN